MSYRYRRYVAVTRPLQTFTGTWRHRRLANAMIAGAWSAAVVITCPPLFGWREPERENRTEVCTLTQDPGYVVYSALGSFYLPLVGLPHCARSNSIFTARCYACAVLFKTILKNSYHVLYPYLPENQYQRYHLRQRLHNKALIPKTTYLSNRDYIMRMLYKNCY